MGQITPYQRNNLASARVGVPNASGAGQAIGESASSFGAALVERQNALDKVQATNMYYQFAREDAVKTAELKQKYKDDPLAFRAAYDKEATSLADKFKTQLPSRVQGKFETRVLQHKATNAGAHETWAFNQQNQNALDGVQVFAQEAVDAATSWTSTDEFLSGRETAVQEFESTYAPVLTTASARLTKNSMKSNMALMYMTSQMDINTGKPLAFRDALETNPELKKALIADLGATKFLQMEKQLVKQVQAFVDEDKFKLMVEGNTVFRDDAIKVMEGKMPLTEIESRVIQAENLLNKMKAENKDGLYDDAIANQANTISYYNELREVARKRSDVLIESKPHVLASLDAELVLAISGMSTPTQQGKLLAKTVSKEGDARDVTPYSTNPVTGLLSRVLPSRGTTLKGSYAKTMERLTEMQGKIVAARNREDISNKDATERLTKIIAPITVMSQYDNLKGTEQNHVARAYTSFNSFIDASYNKTWGERLGGVVQSAEVAKNRRDELNSYRDKLRSDMFMDYMTEIQVLQDSGAKLSGAMYEQLQSRIRTKYARVLHPELTGVEIGGQFTKNGKVRVLNGFDAKTGEPLLGFPGADKAVGNV